MSNYYELLGVSRGASASVVKIAYDGKLKALAKSATSEAERRSEEKELERAYVTLSNPAKASWYDKQLDKDASEASAATGRGTLIGAGVVVLVLAAGIGWYFVERAHKLESLRVEGERLKTEQARLALEREKEERVKEIERARLEQTPSRATTTRRLEIRVSGDERDQSLRERAYNDAQAARDRREVQQQEDRNRRIAEEDRRRALAEVERQKRFVREREYEEERARNARSRR
ncbi:MAG TPA: DnaJ domain-containing protein [Usitatibacter sp.]|nr:DnaJ domain-containing protein [Usitatibacter sp.]